MRAFLIGFLPWGATVVAPFVLLAFSVSAEDLAGTPLDGYAHGFFLALAPLFAFAILYGVLRIAAVALLTPGRAPFLRLALLPLALGVFLFTCLVSTFGGLVLRAGFATGGMSFLEGLSPVIALVLGVAAASAAYGAALGIAVLVVQGGLAPGATGSGRFSPGRLLAGLASFVSLVFAGLILFVSDQMGLSPAPDWPAFPLMAMEAFALAALLAVAFLPHALLCFQRAGGLARAEPVPL